jgi:hypothetical protein
MCCMWTSRRKSGFIARYEKRQPTYQWSSDKHDWYHDRSRRKPGLYPSRQKYPFIEIV